MNRILRCSRFLENKVLRYNAAMAAFSEKNATFLPSDIGDHYPTWQQIGLNYCRVINECDGRTALANTITGEVTDFGESGNLITNIKCEQLADTPRDVTTSIRFDGHETICLYDAEHGEPESTMVAFLGKSGFLEIEIVGMNLAEMLGIAKGSSVSVNW